MNNSNKGTFSSVQHVKEKKKIQSLRLPALSRLCPASRPPQGPGLCASCSGSTWATVMESGIWAWPRLSRWSWAQPPQVSTHWTEWADHGVKGRSEHWSPFAVPLLTDHSALLWSIETGKCLLRYAGHAGSGNVFTVCSVETSKDKTIAWECVSSSPLLSPVKVKYYCRRF